MPIRSLPKDSKPLMMVTRRVSWAILLVLALSLAGAWSPSQAGASGPAPPYAGWAVEAYPEASAAEMEATVRRLVDHGANVVWIGHNNPGEVDANKVEPGLSYAIYEAALDSGDPRHEDAVAIIEAQERMLAACRAVGVPAVLPVGYQIQMGQRWNEEHPDDLRRDADGNLLDIHGGGVSASFYAPSYRGDIEAYYRWVDDRFAEPYVDVILMINLADEPIGGDYSAPADAEFRRRHGFGFAGVGTDPRRQQLLGAFQSRYMVEYARYSAELWQILQPGLQVTMSFDGAQARKTFTMPDVQALFRDTPSNFVVTFDAYPRDGLPHVPMSDEDLVALFLLTRSAGYYSARYGKSLWLWAAANSWGLSQASVDPGSVSDAVANGLYLALLARQGGGDLQGIAYWNYNVKEQGLYNDTHDTAYDVETMFERISAGLPRLQRIMAAPAGRPDVLVLAPPARSHEDIGMRRTAVLLDVQPFERLGVLARAGVNAAVVDSLVEQSAEQPLLDGVRAVIVLMADVRHLGANELEALRAYLRQGGAVVTSPAIGAALAPVDGATPELEYDGLISRQGRLYIARQGIAALFEHGHQEVLGGFWREVLGLEVLQPGYRVVTDQHLLHYHIGSEPAMVSVATRYQSTGRQYDSEAWAGPYLHSSHQAAMLGPREFILLRRARWPWPRNVRARFVPRSIRSQQDTLPR